MSLFQHSVLNKYLKDANQDEMKAAYKRLVLFFHNPYIQQNIRERKEEQFQEGFLRELFVTVLGYTISPDPDFNLTTEFKNERGAKKADGAILIDGAAIGVIELKSTKTKDLESIRLQAFDYKANQQKCIYVITSNFEKIRFYINNAVDFEEFDLFKLKYEAFQLLWLCLAKDNLLKGIPLAIKEASVLKEENVTKQIYVDYSLFKRELYSDLIANNLNLEIFEDKEEKEIKLLLFKKSQKLLDRFLFIFFGEDRGLLPPNSISEIIKQWEQLKELDEYKPLYDRYKKYFGYLNTGWKGKKHEIFAYNGGLFAPDEILDSIIINDEVLQKHTKVLTAYDFETDVDVNILGHIFENSLNEIEEITAKILSETTEHAPLFPTQRAVSKRKKDGVFYTPKYITKYIVENTVGKLCTEKKTELGIEESEYLKSRKGRPVQKLKELSEKLDTYRNWLLTLTICDPSCGSGAFLNQALDYLIREHHYIDELKAKLLDVPMIFTEVENSILENNIFGVDINEESVEIAKLSLWLRTAQKGRKLTTLSNNIKCGNSLIDNPEIAGEKAFNWQNEFADIFRKKEKIAWHVTFVTHDTRTSARMIKYKVRERKANGEMYVDRSVYLDDNDAIKITEIIAEIVYEEKLNCLAYNIGIDHVHMLLVCEKEELTNIVRKLKGKSAQKFKEHLGIFKDETFNLWAQKFNRKPIRSEEQLQNTLEYIIKNREKHFDSDEKQGIATPALEERECFNKGLQPLVKKMTCSREYAFRTEFTGGFDVVIGNPPYVLCQPSNTKGKVLNFYKGFKVASYKIDLFHLFFEKSIILLKSGGSLGFITPNTYLNNKFIKPLRNFILTNASIDKLVNHKEIVFADAGVDVATIILSKNVIEKNEIEILETNESSYFEKVGLKKQKSWIEDQDNIFNIKKEFKIKLSGCIQLIDICSSYFGIQAYDRKSSISIDKINSDYLPIIDGGDIFPYQYSIPTKYFNYIDENIKSGGDYKFYKNERIVIRQIGKVPIIGLCKGDILCSNTLYNINLTNEHYSLKFILAILNSNFIKAYWLSNYSDSKQLFPKIKGYQLKSIPIKETSKEIQNEFEIKVELILSSTMIFNQLLQKLTGLLSNKYDIKKLSKKLQSWHELDFKGFLNELKKAKVKLSLSEEAEWMQYFNEQKQKAQNLKSEIDKTDREIDQMVYELYGLTEEEIGIVEGT